MSETSMGGDWVMGSFGDYWLDRDGDQYCVWFKRAGYSGAWYVTCNGRPLGDWSSRQAAQDFVEKHKRP